jgi:hypothetical protein
MSNNLPLLLAAPGVNEIFSVLVAIVFFVVWLVKQINEAKQQQKQKEQRTADEESPQPAGAARENAAPAPAPDPLRAQVDEFLRRAGKQPAGQGAPPSPPPRKPPGREEIVVLLDESVAAPPRRPGIERKKLPSAKPEARGQRPPAPPRETQPAAPKRRAEKPRPKSVSEHVAERVGASTQQFRQEVANLGERVKQADEQFDRQLAQKFDHELGSLGGRASSSEQPAQPAAPTPAFEIAALLASPAGVRSAIVLNEILQRPTDRW